MTKAAKSHSIPKSWLRAISKDYDNKLYYVPQVSILSQDDTPYKELTDGLDAGVFRSLCNKCEVSMPYENEPKCVLPQSYMRDIARKEIMSAFYTTKLTFLDDPGEEHHVRRYELLYKVAEIAEYRILYDITVPNIFNLNIAGHVITSPMLPSRKFHFPWIYITEEGKTPVPSSLIFLVFRRFNNKTKITIFGKTSTEFYWDLKDFLRSQPLEEKLAMCISWLFQSQGNFAYGLNHQIPYNWFIDFRYQGPWIRHLLGEPMTYDSMEEAWDYHLSLCREFVKRSKSK